MLGFRLKKTAAEGLNRSKPFNPLTPNLSPPSTGERGEISSLITEVLNPAHFFASPPIALDLVHFEHEEQSWEIFQGRLLDPAHTRQVRTFDAWNLYQVDESGRSGVPLLAVQLDAAVAILF